MSGGSWWRRLIPGRGGDASDVDIDREIGHGVVAKFTMALIGFVGTIVFARLLTPSAFGGFYLLLAVVHLAVKPMQGLGRALKKRVSEHDADRGQHLGAFLVGYGVAVLLVGLLAFVGGPLLTETTGVPFSGALAFALFASIALFAPVQSALSGTGRVGLSRWIDTVRSVGTFVLQLILVLAGWSAVGLAVGLAATTVLTVPLLAYFLHARPGVPTRETASSLAAYARFSVPSAAVGEAYRRYDTLLLGILLAPAVVADYEIAYKLALPAMFVAEVAGSGLMARVSNLTSRGGDGADEITRTLGYTSVLAVPIFFGAAAIPEPLVTIVYGDVYADAAPFLVGLALYQVVRSQTDPMQNAISGIDRPDVNLRISGVTLAFNLVAGYALLVAMGGIGVVVATVLAETIRYLLCSRVIRSEFVGVSLRSRPMAAQVFAGALMFAVTLGLARTLRIDSWPLLLATVGVAALAYTLVLLATSSTIRMQAQAVLRRTGLLGRSGE